MPTAQPLRTGDPRRLGAYELSGRLGEGGQGVVYLGTRIEDVYAVKLLHGPVGDEKLAFLREVELAKQVARFCTAQVVDAGFDEGRPYIVSEYVDGPSLQREVAITGPRRGAALERLAVSTITALAAIHRAGIVHRDFKPQNVLLGPDGPRVIDFGLARALDAAATVSGRGVGTPAYMAPEQITASALTGAADVFSWGATMCFAANASAPFGQDSVAPVLHRILTAPPELGRLDGRLRELVMACLDKDARNRPASRELLLALLGDNDFVPPEVLRSPPPHILRALPAPSVAHGAANRLPMAEPEATGAPAGYRLRGASPDDGTSWPPIVPRQDSGEPDVRWDGAEDVGPPYDGAGSSRGPWGEPGRRTRQAVGRAALAVTAALLVSGAVLVAVLLPTVRDENQVRPQAVERPSVVTTGPPSTATAPELGRSPAKRGERALGGHLPATQSPPAGLAVVRVPALAGMEQSTAIKAIKRAGFAVGAVTQVDSREKIGKVVSSSPAGGVTAARGSTVSLQVSAGLAVPAVVGLGSERAEAALTGAGLVVGETSSTCSDRPDGQVLSSRPGAGSRVSGGTKVALVLARHGAAVPAVAGESKAAARTALQAAGFTASFKTQVVTDDEQVDVALAQSVAAGSCAKPGATVVVTVGVAGQSDPDPTEPTPTVTTSETSQPPE
ncbi:serine/threonine-protein kinase [Nonomuraea guangzhouensis]|uniref:non-specific serine/threonine protein kinase n=1 Tax=Nonomuraea guangzhouensis TaxID=1291555 RepID=A0ABW4GWG4_9ACTN|nr:serine/threonine-protein kinase [Nonomuraea guangzhouensis]